MFALQRGGRLLPRENTTARIVTEVGRLLDKQAELMQLPFKDLTQDQLKQYEQRRERIRQLCSELKGLNSYEEV